MRAIRSASPSFRALSQASSNEGVNVSATDHSFDVVDSIADDGPMVVSMTTAAAKEVRNQPDGI